MQKTKTPEKMTFRNKRNGNKYIDFVHYADGHYYAIQYLRWNVNSEVITNYMGRRVRQKAKFRFNKSTIMEILEDYIRIA